MRECERVYMVYGGNVYLLRLSIISSKFLWIILVLIFTKHCTIFQRILQLFTILKSLESIFEKRPEITIGTAWCSAKRFASPWYPDFRVLLRWEHRQKISAWMHYTSSKRIMSFLDCNINNSSILKKIIQPYKETKHHI